VRTSVHASISKSGSASMLSLLRAVERHDVAQLAAAENAHF
jgi:hypothetical protein